MMKIIISGGTGLIGRALCRKLIQDGHDVSILSRNADTKIYPEVKLIKWNGVDLDGRGNAVDGADVVINLAGQSIGESRWTPAQKTRIIQSRLKAGAALTNACLKADRKPGLLVQASAIGYYGSSGDIKLGESAPQGDDFLANLCRDWEESTRPVESIGIRRVVTRIGLVLAHPGGVLDRLMLPFRLFAGGRLGSGRQWYSWIHIEDVVGAMKYCIDHKELDGIYNLTAPEAVTMDQFGKCLGNVMHRPYWFPVPEMGLRLALGEMSKLVVEGQRVYPARLLEAGYNFRFNSLKPALEDLIGR